MWHISQEWSHAGEVLDWFAEKGWEASLMHWADPHTWSLVMRRPVPAGLTDDEAEAWEDDMCVRADGHTGPEAIAKAAALAGLMMQET